MKRSLRRMAALVAALALPAVGLAAAGPAQAAAVQCGDVITASVTLTADLTCPGGNGLTVQGANVQVNLNGHTISGGPLSSAQVTEEGAVNDPGQTYYTVYFTTGQYVGITVLNSTGVKILGPGRIEHFAAGVLIDGGSTNRVEGVTIADNQGPVGTAQYGDGLIVVNSDANKVAGNTVTGNGPLSGITLLGDSDSNQVSGNIVADNTSGALCANPAGCLIGTYLAPQYAITRQVNFGIRIEGDGPNGEGANFNTLDGNTVTNSGNNGIVILAICHNGGPGNCPPTGLTNSNNVVKSNKANGNGFGSAVGRDPVRSFGGVENGTSGIALTLFGPNVPTDNLVAGNQANGNSRHGIFISTGAGNKVEKNSASGNNASPVAGGAASYNGIDANPDCGTNTWSKNTFGAIIGGPPNAPTNQPCVK